MKNAMRALAVTAVAGLAFGLATDADAKGHKKAAPKSCPQLNQIDPDNDGSMTLGEAKRRALAVFAKINPDGDRTLEAGEVKGRVSAKQFAAADMIRKDGKLSRLEWLLLTRSLFKHANPDGDRTIECDELHSPAGKSLYKMLK